MRRLSGIDLGRENVMQAELSRKNVLHNMYSMLPIPRVRIPIEDVYFASETQIGDGANSSRI